MKNVILLLLVSFLSTALQSADTNPVNFPEKKWEIKDIDHIKQLIKSGIIIKTIYDGFGRELPPLIYFCNCVQSKESNAFYPCKSNEIGNEHGMQLFNPEFDIIEILLQQKANPLYQTKLHCVDKPSIGFFWMAYSLQDKEYKVAMKILNEDQNNRLNTLLEKYNGSNKNTTNPYLTDEKETTPNKGWCTIS